jgi:hypothetical protein
MADAAAVRKYFSHLGISGTNLQLFTQNGFLVESFFTTLGLAKRATGFSADRAMIAGATINEVRKDTRPTAVLAAFRRGIAPLNLGHRLAKVA